jgi:hypothetical protein
MQTVAKVRVKVSHLDLSETIVSAKKGTISLFLVSQFDQKIFI